MNQPISMVIFNILVLLLTIALLVLFTYFFPKKKINLLVLLILISLLPILSIFRDGIYESSDMRFHVFRTISFFNVLREENSIPLWAGELNATYGYPLFIFIYPLPYFIASIFHVLGLSFITSVKVLLAFSYVLSTITMYFWIKEEINKKAGFIAGVFYLFSPYHLVVMHFRADIGEALAFAFLPFTFLCVFKLLQNTKKKWIVLTAVSFCLLILSHQAISLTAFPLLLCYGIFCWKRVKTKQIKQLVTFFLAYFLGLLLSSFYWVPIFFESKFTHQSIYDTIVFPHILDFIYSSWMFGFLFQGTHGQLSFVIGYFHWIIILYTIFVLWKKKLQKPQMQLVIFSLISFFILFFLMQSFSKPIWDMIPLIKKFQFSYRLLVITSLFSAVIAGTMLIHIQKKYIVILFVFLTISSTILNWGNRKMLSEIQDKDLVGVFMQSTAQGEGLGPAAPMWTNSKSAFMKDIPKTHLEKISGNAEIKEVFRSNTKHKYIINVTQKTVFKENTVYFPGWKLFVNNNEYPIYYQNKKYPGIITFILNPGRYNLQLVFIPIIIQKVSLFISLLTLCFLSLLLILPKKLFF